MKKPELTSLCKFIATAGVAARRKALFLIKEGFVSVNNIPITEPGYKVSPLDKIKCNDMIVKPEKKVYIILNKPKNCVTTACDELDRRTVLDLIKVRNLPRIFPVGRLDRDTTGLVLLTNDGELAQQLAHPHNRINKTYLVSLNRPFEAVDLDKLRFGFFLSDGRVKPDKVHTTPNSKKYNVIIELHSGKNRIVRRIFEFLGYKVRALERVKFAGLTKQGLELGAWRYLTPFEIERLIKNATPVQQTNKGKRPSKIINASRNKSTPIQGNKKIK